MSKHIGLELIVIPNEVIKLEVVRLVISIGISSI